MNKELELRYTIIGRKVKPTGKWKLVSHDGSDPTLYIECEYEVMKFLSKKKKFLFVFSYKTYEKDFITEKKFIPEYNLNIVETYENECNSWESYLL
jgi:polynucleotide 5'-kinase involved in rRNA processing